MLTGEPARLEIMIYNNPVREGGYIATAATDIEILLRSESDWDGFELIERTNILVSGMSAEEYLLQKIWVFTFHGKERGASAPCLQLGRLF